MLISQYAAAGDPIVMSRIIANALLAQLRGPAGYHIEPLNIVNMLRLLDMYSTDTFDTPEPLGILEEETFSDLNEINEARRSQRLKEALDATREALLPGATPAEFASTIGGALRKLIQPGNLPYEPQDIEKTESFLSELSNALSGD
jgi:hypothetical protein